MVVFSCNEKDQSLEIDNIQLAIEALDKENKKTLDKIRDLVDERGKRPDEVKKLDEIYSLVKGINDLYLGVSEGSKDAVLSSSDDQEAVGRFGRVIYSNGTASSEN